MQHPLKRLLSTGLFLLCLSALPVHADPSFWIKGTPTPVTPEPPQIAPWPAATETSPASAPATATAPLLPDQPSPTATPEPGRSPKRPLTGALLSAFVPGSGHVYTGEPLKGLLFAGVFGVTLWQSIDNFEKIGTDYKARNATAGQLYGLAALVTYGFSVQDAWDSANRYNRRFHLKLAYDGDRNVSLFLARSF